MSLFLQAVNSGVAAGTPSTKAVSLTGQGAGNLNVVIISWGNISGPSISATVSSVTDSNGHTYSKVCDPVYTGANTGPTQAFLLQAYYFAGITAGSTTVTVTLSAGASFFTIDVLEYAITQAVPLESSAGGYSPYLGSSTITTANLRSLNGTGTLIAAAACYDGASAVGTGYTQRDKYYTLVIGDKDISGAAGTYNTSLTSTGTHGSVALLMSFSTVAVPSAANDEVRLTDTLSSSLVTAPSLSNLIDDNNWTWGPGTDASMPGSAFLQQAGAPVIPTRVRLSAITGGNDLPIGASFQGSTEPSFLSPVTLVSLSNRPNSGTLMMELDITSATRYQYYRWICSSHTGTSTQIADLEIYASGAASSISQCADVVISPPTLNFDLPTYITLSSITQSAAIHYTIDGSTPTTGSPLYSGPFVISSSCTLQAIATSSSYPSSRIVSRPVHIGATEVSTDDIFDDRGYRLWAMNGNLYQDPQSHWWYRYGNNADTAAYYTYGFVGNNCYRSGDLRNWQFRGAVVAPAAGNEDLNTSNQLNHIAFHVLYNASTSKYVAWADSYNVVSSVFTFVAKTVFTASSPEGPFTQVRQITSVGAITQTNNVEGDFSLFLDSDGISAYLISTMGDTGSGTNLNTNLVIVPLSSDYTNLGTATITSWSTATGGSATKREAPWMTKVGSTYYLLHSGTAGFASSDCRYMTSSSVTGPWSGYVLPFVGGIGGAPDYTISYDTQDWQILFVPGRGYIYHGDHYAYTGSAFPNLKRYRLPVVFSGGTMSISWSAAWSFDGSLPNSGGVGLPVAATSVQINHSTPYQISWVNNEPYPATLYLDSATDSLFSNFVGGTMLPSGATSVSVAAPTGFYRIRTVNASGSAVSAVIPATPQVTVIYDSNHLNWTCGAVQAGQLTGVVYVDGRAAGNSANATQIAYVSHTVWYVNATNNWFAWSGDTYTGQWVAGANPLVTGSGGTWNDSATTFNDGVRTWNDSGQGTPFGLSPSGIPTSVRMGTPANTAVGPVNVSPAGILTSTGVGRPSVDLTHLSAIGIPSSIAVGTPAVGVAASGINLSGGGIPTSIHVGSPLIQLASAPIAIVAVGIPSSIGVGKPLLTGFVTASGIVTSVHVGTPALGLLNAFAPPGVTTSIRLGTPALSTGVVGLNPSGIPTSIIPGTPSISSQNPLQPQSIHALGIPTSVAAGTPAIGNNIIATYLTVLLSGPVLAPNQSATFQIVAPWGQSDVCENFLDALQDVFYKAGSVESGRMGAYFNSMASYSLVTQGPLPAPNSATDTASMLSVPSLPNATPFAQFVLAIITTGGVVPGNFSTIQIVTPWGQSGQCYSLDSAFTAAFEQPGSTSSGRMGAYFQSGVTDGLASNPIAMVPLSAYPISQTIPTAQTQPGWVWNEQRFGH